MNKEQTLQLLRMAYSLMKKGKLTTVRYAVGRDLYDFAERNTRDIGIKFLMLGNNQFVERITILRHILSTSNIDF